MQEGAALPRARPRRFPRLGSGSGSGSKKSLRADPWRGGELPNRRPSIRGLPPVGGAVVHGAPFVFPLCSLSVPLLFPFCSHLLGGWEFHKGYRHVTDVYTSRTKGFPFATLRLYESILTRCAFLLCPCIKNKATRETQMGGDLYRNGTRVHY